MQQAKHNSLLFYLLAGGLVFAWSAIAPHDRITWCLEVAPIAIALPILLLTYKRFPLSPLVYLLIFIHAIILMIGAHYTYAEVPLFNWLKDSFELSRNHYDRVGHFAQGFVPAITARELLLRNTALTSNKWLFAIIVLSCTGISATYELLEWVSAEILGQGADAFLGSQGDVWDTQKDMALAMLGASLALLTLSKLHDKQLGS